MTHPSTNHPLQGQHVVTPHAWYHTASAERALSVLLPSHHANCPLSPLSFSYHARPHTVCDVVANCPLSPSPPSFSPLSPSPLSFSPLSFSGRLVHAWAHARPESALGLSHHMLGTTPHQPSVFDSGLILAISRAFLSPMPPMQAVSHVYSTSCPCGMLINVLGGFGGLQNFDFVY